MATSQIVVPSHWRPFYEATGIPAAVRFGDEVTVAGVGWAEVVELHSYHVGLAAQSEVLLEIAGAFMTRPFPAWTAVGVVELFDAEALVEVSCRAFGRSG